MSNKGHKETVNMTYSLAAVNSAIKGDCKSCVHLKKKGGGSTLGDFIFSHCTDQLIY